MENIAHLEVALNREAVFAQIQLRTTGTSYDDSLELFRKNRHRQKVGMFADTLITIAELRGLALTIFEARQLTCSTEECGAYLGFAVQMIFDGGIKTHVDISAAGEVSTEFEDWYGEKPVEFLDDDDVPAPAPVIRRLPRTPQSRRPVVPIRPRRKTV